MKYTILALIAFSFQLITQAANSSNPQEIILELPAYRSAEDSKLIDYKCENRSAVEILLDVARKANVNVVIPPGLVEYKVSMKIEKVTWRQIFEAVLQESEFTYIEDRNIIKVVPFSNLCHTHNDTKIYEIKNRDASDVARIIEFTLRKEKDRSGVIVDQGLNLLIVDADVSRLHWIDKIIGKLDKKPDDAVDAVARSAE